jgi:hypothetical protein
METRQNMKRTILASLLLACAAHVAAETPRPATAVPSPAAVKAAKYAVTTYRTKVVDTLAKLVSFNTVATPDLPSDQDPQHIAFKNYLKTETQRLGFDFADHGWVVVIGMGQGTERVGIVTHGDVQPVDPSKWKKSPFVLDQTSEPGKLLARGAEDDKGPIATALYAMKALKDQQLPLSKRIELYVYMGEESNWQPLVDFLKTHEPPQMNITLDAEYPAVVAEKASGTIAVTLPARRSRRPAKPTFPRSRAASSAARSRKTPAPPLPTRRLRWKRRSAPAAPSRTACATNSRGREVTCWSRRAAYRPIRPSRKTASTRWRCWQMRWPCGRGRIRRPAAS